MKQNKDLQNEKKKKNLKLKLIEKKKKLAN